MSYNYIKFKTMSKGRNNLRKEVINKFLEEAPGIGKGVLCSKYEYEVECYKNYIISIKRPGLFNKGFDFTVNIPRENYLFKKNKRYNNPTHQDIIDALKYNKEINPSNHNKIQKLLEQLYNSNNIKFPNSSLGCFLDYEGNKHPIEIIILSCKWLFIEQDIRYWNWSGRQMFWNSLVENGLVSYDN